MGDEQFSEDFDALGAKKPAPHECMSCVVGLRTFPSCFETSAERSLFARCIIGMEIRFAEKPPEFREEIGPERNGRRTKTGFPHCLGSSKGMVKASL